jgi:hypothetical protein
MYATVWNGTDRELKDLNKAITNNQTGTSPNSTCDPCTNLCPHRLLTDQKIMDHLVFVRRKRRNFIIREFMETESRN